MKVNKIITVSLCASLVLAVMALPKVEAQTVNTNSTEIQKLLEQLVALQEQLKTLQGQRSAVAQELNQTLRLARQLSKGMTGEEVKLLQEVLATDPSIYPEGIINGIFGPRTEAAVKKFQEKNGLDAVGRVGPQTLSRLNQILTEGAGKSGKVPPGLLIAPGIAKKLDNTPSPLPGQILPPGIAKKLDRANLGDTTAPILRGIGATSNSSSTATVAWSTDEAATGKVWWSISANIETSGAVATSSSALTRNHTFTFTGLNASTTYYYIVGSTDAAGNTASSSKREVSTLKE
jgi:peptidoglycan hydrolase-like protein with peptidoglycan-binding domain